MGLIRRDGYEVKGILIQPAYAKITDIRISNAGIAHVNFGISNSRENIEKNNGLEEITFTTLVDKESDKIYHELYTKAKAKIFTDWEDDIVAVDETEEISEDPMVEVPEETEEEVEPE